MKVGDLVTAQRPTHAQAGALADLRWSSGTRWGACALLAALAIGSAATLGATARPAVAALPVPPAALSATDQPLGDPLGQQATDAPPGGLGGASGTVPAPPASGIAGVPGNANDGSQASSLASDGIPTTALTAYQQAAARERTVDPACGLTWPLLAGIGRVESDHGRFSDSVLHTDGVSSPHIIGIPLNGIGTARITDTDGGRLDGDTVYDRAVGSMQFIPSTWAAYGVDANHDGVADPFNIFDAAAAAAHYLCAAGGNLTTADGQVRAVRAYNDSDAYIALVMQLESVYARGVPGLTVPIVPVLPGGSEQSGPAVPDPRPNPQPGPPPVDPGPPLGLPKPKPKPHQKPTPVTPGSSPASTTPSVTSCPTPSITPTDTASPTVTVSALPSSTSCPTPTVTPTDTVPVTPTDTATTPTPTGTAPSPATGVPGVATASDPASPPLSSPPPTSPPAS